MRVSKFSLAAFALAIVSCLSLAACGGSNAAATPTNTPKPTLTADQIIMSAKAASPKAATYSLDITSVTAGKSDELKEQVSYTTNPKQADVSLTTTDSGKTSTLETIETAEFVYVQVGGQWIKSPATTPVDVTSLDIAHSLLTTVQGTTLVGSDTVNGMATYHLQANQAALGASGAASGKVDFWVRQDNYYLVKVVINGQANGSTVTGNIQYTAWDDEVKITIPNV